MIVQYYLMLNDIQSFEDEKSMMHPKFKVYVTSLNEVPDHGENNQNKKRTHFFRYVKESLMRHFQQWTNSLSILVTTNYKVCGKAVIGQNI